VRLTAPHLVLTDPARPFTRSWIEPRRNELQNRSRCSGELVLEKGRLDETLVKEGNVMKLVSLLAALAASVLALSASSVAATRATVWTAALSSGQEVPPQVVKDAAAHGLFKGTLSGNKLSWKLTFAKLTGPAIAAHIHMGAKGASGNVVVPLCAGSACKSGLTGMATITPALMAAFKKHDLYVNVHTTKNPNGEIRGQLAVG
jgi:CHRD domain